MTKEELEREYYDCRPTEPYSEDDSPNDWANIVQYAEENLGKVFKAIAELEKENERLKAFERHCDEIEEDAKAIAKENAELKEKLDKIRNYLAYDIFDRFKYLENLLKISQETQEELSKRILEQQKTIGSAIKNQIEKILNKFK